MPFAAPLHWPLTLLCATLALISLFTFLWWIQLPTLPQFRPSLSSSAPLWYW